MLFNGNVCLFYIWLILLLNTTFALLSGENSGDIDGDGDCLPFWFDDGGEWLV